MKKVSISAGKLRGLIRIADKEGRFRIMGMGAQATLRRALAQAVGKDVAGISFEDIAAFKRSVIEVLSDYFSVVSVDPIYGYPSCIKYLSRYAGLILSIEKRGYESVGEKSVERKTHLLPEWVPGKAKRAGADAVKLIIYYRKEVSRQVFEYQRSIAKDVGNQCERYDIPYILEIMSYPVRKNEQIDNLAFAQNIPAIVIDYAKEFSQPEYKADILKIEFPANLKYCKEFSHGEFDGKRRKAAYSLSEIKDFCKNITDSSSVPWIVLSGGVGIEEFLIKVKIATDYGASAFLGGRAIWEGAVQLYPDVDKMENWLSTNGVDIFHKLQQASQNAIPYFNHRKFGSLVNIEIDLAGEHWYVDYGDFT